MGETTVECVLPKAASGGKLVPNEAIRIKRYPNRRFYDSQASKYVTLSEIERMIRKGVDVEIVDSATEEDITRVVLIQMIVEHYPEKVALFPTAMLHSILRSNDVMSEFLQDYLRNSLAYLDYFQWHGASKPAAQPMHWMQAWLDGTSPAAGKKGARKRTTAAGRESAEMAARVAMLERRIAELESQRSSKSKR